MPTWLIIAIALLASAVVAVASPLTVLFVGRALRNRRIKKVMQQPRVILPHAFDPDQLMLLFPELGEEQQPGMTGDGVQDIQADEKIVGYIERPFTQALASYMMLYSRRTAEAQIKGRYGTDAERAEAVENYHRFDQAEDALRELLWLAIKQEIGVWNKTLGLRKGWTIVECKPQPNAPDILRRLFGNQE